MNNTEIVIKVDILYFLGFIGTLLGITWYASRRLGNIQTSIEWIKRELGNLWDAVKGRDAIRAGVEATGSPVNPTELGWKYIRESNLENIVDVGKKDELIKMLRNLLGKNYTEYDVQENARKVFLSLKDDPIFKPVKEYAFNNGIDFDIILRLGGLLLRDNFLGKPHEIAPLKKLG